MIRLAIVCPCFNEEAVLSQSVKLLSGILAGLVYNGKISADSFLMLVDDGSSDGTWKIIEDLHDGDKAGIKAISFSRNYGHQNAIFAGMMQCRGICDGVITMDVDLQDDPACIEQMVDACSKGYDVVYGVRSARNTDTFFKRFTAEAFYRLSQKLGNETVYNHADYRFLSARVLDVLASYDERGLYLRGLIPQIGFSSTTVSYERLARKEGETKFTFPKMLSLAVNGLTLSTNTQTFSSYCWNRPPVNCHEYIDGGDFPSSGARRRRLDVDSFFIMVPVRRLADGYRYYGRICMQSSG